MERNSDMESKKISVIIPVYNVASYLSRCLDSIIGQTYQNLEIIVVDDGSVDGSAAICDAYAKKDRRVIVIHQKNGGLSAARNAGLDRMTGEMVGFVDSDDWIDLDYYECLLETQRKTDADMVQVSYCEVWDSEISAKHIDNGLYNSENALIRLEQGGLYGYMVTHIYKSSLWKGLRFPEDRYPCEDARTMYKLFLRADKIACVDRAKYYYAKRGDSITGSKWIMMEVFFSRYERYMECIRLEREGKAFPGCSRIFLEPLAAAAYDAAYLSTPEQWAYRNLGALAARFWETNKKEIAGIGKGFWGGYYPAKVYFPKLTVKYIKCRRYFFKIVKKRMPPKVQGWIKKILGRE